MIRSPDHPTPSQLLEELTRRTRNIDPAGHAALAVLHPLDDAGGLAALGTVVTLRRVHHLHSISRLGYLDHDSLLTGLTRSLPLGRDVFGSTTERRFRLTAKL